MRVLALTAAMLIPTAASAEAWQWEPNEGSNPSACSAQIDSAAELGERAESSDPLYLQTRGPDRDRDPGRFLAAGTWELIISGNGSNDSDFDAGGFGLNVGIGYYVLDGLALALRQNATYADTGSDSSWIGSTRVAADYHFDFDRWQPFIGAQIGYNYGEGVRDTWQAGPEAGVKWFIKDEAFLYGMVEYQFFFRNGSDADNNFDDGQFVYTIGVGFTF